LHSDLDLVRNGYFVQSTDNDGTEKDKHLCNKVGPWPPSERLGPGNLYRFPSPLVGTEEKWPLPGLNPWTVQLAAGRCTDRAIPATYSYIQFTIQYVACNERKAFTSWFKCTNIFTEYFECKSPTSIICLSLPQSQNLAAQEYMKCILFRRRERKHTEIHLLGFFLPSCILPLLLSLLYLLYPILYPSFFDMSLSLSLSLWPKMFNTLFSSTLSIRSSYEVRDMASHPYKTTGKIILLYILIFIILASKLEDDRFCTEWQQECHKVNLLLIYSWMEFWFLGVVPKYLNCSALSKDLSPTYIHN